MTGPPYHRGVFDRLRCSPRLVTGLALAAVVANTVIVVTGALVRLTGSGLGCPSWPRCGGSSFVTTPQYGIHGVIEFGNRALTFVLAAVVGACIVATTLQRPRRRDLTLLAWGLFAGVAAQGVLGGITVLTHLNPWIVAGHFLVSMALIAAAVALHVRSMTPEGPTRPVGPPQVAWLGRAVVTVTAAVLVLGTMVTGSGPHGGDRLVARTGFDPAAVSQLHANAVMLLIGLTAATMLVLRLTRAQRRAQTAAALLASAELAQGAVGYLQYFTDLPVGLVAVHVLGSCLVWLAAVYLFFAIREPAGSADPEQSALSATSAGVPAR